MKTAVLLVSGKFSHHERILHPGQVVEVRGLKSEIGKRQRAEISAFTTLSTIKLWKGWGTQLYGLVKGAPPAKAVASHVNAEPKQPHSYKNSLD